jgi:predicted amidophosphoribosyltransferase
MLNELKAMVNPTSTCAICGQEKHPAHQWCEECWSLLPRQSAMHYSKAMRDLNKRIYYCNRKLKDLTFDKKAAEQAVAK